MSKYLFLMTKIFVVITFSVFVSCLIGCEETYEKTEKDDDPIVSPDEDYGDDENLDDDEDNDGNAGVGDDDDADTDDDTDKDDDDGISEDDSCQAQDAEKIKSVVIGTYNTHLFLIQTVTPPTVQVPISRKF
ncbi:hypothetical protein J6Z19_06460 [bacterium]|nr:hypothetical protein [bacterium]